MLAILKRGRHASVVLIDIFVKGSAKTQVINSTKGNLRPYRRSFSVGKAKENHFSQA